MSCLWGFRSRDGVGLGWESGTEGTGGTKVRVCIGTKGRCKLVERCKPGIAGCGLEIDGRDAKAGSAPYIGGRSLRT